MTDDRFEKVIEEMAKSYNEPPEPLREEMWTQIEALRRERRQRKHGQWWYASRWGIGIAAVLAVGIGIGRISSGPEEAASGPAVAAGETAAEHRIYRFAAAQHLEQVEAFLTGFRMDARAGRQVAETGGLASAPGLLGTTRLLLDSPASEDPRLHTLLEEIELVLAQIAQVTGVDDREELDFIDDSIERRGVMLRLQSALAADAPAGAQGAL